MTDDYANFDSLIDDVVKAACYADARNNGWSRNPDGTLTYAFGGGTAPQPGPGQGYPDYPLAPSDGNITGPGEDGQLRDPSTSLGDTYRTWESVIPPLFEPLRNLPDPADFQARADDVRMALKQLSSNGHRGSSDSTDSDESSANIDYEGNSTLGLASQAAQQLNAWQGHAASAFATYLNLFTVVVGNQALACEVLRITLLEEKELWARTRADAVTFAKNAANAFEGTGGITVGDVKALLSVVGTINTVLGWFPAFKPVTSAVGKATTVTGLLVDTLGSTSEPSNDLGARAMYDVLHKCQSHRDDLVKYTQTVEGDIQKSLENLKSHIDSAPPARVDGSADQPSYTLARPNQTYHADSVDDFVYNTVTINPQNVIDTASILDGDIGPEMQTAATSLDDAESLSGWYRPDGSIGCGSFGCWDEYFAASTLLQSEIQDTAKEMAWAGEMLRDVARVMKGQDDSVADDFKQVRGKIHDYDHPAPPPPPPGGYGHKPIPVF